MAGKFNNLVNLYQTSVERFADNPLFGTKTSGEWKWTTYRDVGEAVDAARGGLASLGVKRGDRVAIIADNQIPWAVAAYATYGLGAAYVPMYEAQLDKDWKYILGDSGAKVVLVAGERIRDRVAGFKSDLPDLEHIVVIEGSGDDNSRSYEELLATGRAAPVGAVQPDDKEIAGFIYTSGTTGNPKGVLLSHGNLISNINALHVVFPLEPEDRSASFLPWAHSFGQTVELHTLVSYGASLGLTSAKTLIADLPEIQPTMLVSVPTVFNRVYDGLLKRMAETGGAQKAVFDAAMANARRRAELSKEGKKTRWVELQHRLYDRLVFKKVRDAFGGRLKYAFSGGAAISPEVAEFISALGITVYEGYGLTETSPVVTANNRQARRVGSVGKAVPDVRVEIDTDLTGEKDIGEIVVYGPNVMQGYYNLPEENAAAFTDDGGFRTGDLGHLDEDGFLFIRGRIKEQYKLENGKYVVPSPIEEQLQLSGYVTNIMVYGEQRPHNVAVIVPDFEALEGWAEAEGLAGGEPQALLSGEQVRQLYKDELRSHSAGIKHYELVRDFILVPDDFTVENGMLTPSLKIKRRAVMEKYGSDIEAMYA